MNFYESSQIFLVICPEQIVFIYIIITDNLVDCTSAMCSA